MPIKNEKFGQLFKKYRLKSGFATLRQLADYLASLGLVYDESLFSRWQKGERVPKNRHLILLLIKIFCEKKAIESMEEINNFLFLANQKGLDEEEKEIFKNFFAQKQFFNVPILIDNFIGRDSYIKKISWLLLTKKSVLVYGLAGVGKTALAIKIAHFLRPNFADGVFWYRLDIKNFNSILDEIGSYFNLEIEKIKDQGLKIKTIKTAIKNKKVLFIFDNIENFNLVESFVSQISPVLITSKYFPERNLNLNKIHLNGLTTKEFLILAQNLLGKPFVLMNKEKLKSLAKLWSYLPLALNIILKQIRFDPKKLDFFLKKNGKNNKFIYQQEYNGKNLFQSLSSAVEILSDKEKNFFYSLKSFSGEDFSLKAAAFITNLSARESHQTINKLKNLSLIENSVKGRFRFHPLIKQYLQDKKIKKEIFYNLAEYFLNLLSKYPRATLKSYCLIEKEVENILGVFNACFHFHFYKKTIDLWEYLGVYLWDRGYWQKINKVKDLVIIACQETKNFYYLALIFARDFSWLYYWQGEINKAKEYIEESLKIVNNHSLKDALISAYINQRLGMIYQKENQLDKAETCLKEALQILKKLKKNTIIGDTFLYLGHVFRKKGDLQKGEDFYFRSYQLLRKNKDHEGAAIALYYLGEVYMEKKNYLKAINYLRKALIIDKVKKRQAGVGWCNFALGRIKLEQNKIKEGLNYLKQARQVFLNLGMKEQILEVDKYLYQFNQF